MFSNLQHIAHVQQCILDLQYLFSYVGGFLIKFYFFVSFLND